jgi:hypothetical protein
MRFLAEPDVCFSRRTWATILGLPDHELNQHRWSKVGAAPLNVADMYSVIEGGITQMHRKLYGNTSNVATDL